MFIKAAKIEDIAVGGLKGVELKGHEITLANVGGKIYAVERRCSHMNAPLELGTLNGKIIICPMHFARFDVTTGEKLAGPVPSRKLQGLPDITKNYFEHLEILMSKISTHDLKTYKVKVEGSDILVDL